VPAPGTAQRVTARRYRHYRRALDLVGGLERSQLAPAGQQLLEELAEDMLLSREADPHGVVRLRREAELAVRELSLVGVLPEPTADELTQLLLDAGPPLLAEVGPIRRQRAA
jgi:hypothetical protein